MVCGPVLGVIDALLKKVRDCALQELGLKAGPLPVTVDIAKLPAG